MNFLRFLEQEKDDYWFHGRTVRSTDFDVKFVDDKGNRQDGPGFYFTREPEEAERYSGEGGVVLKVKLNTDRIVTGQSNLGREEVVAILQKSNALDDILMDWAENPREALEMLLDSLMSYEDDPVELLQQIWADGFRDDRDFLKVMVECGIDGTATMSKWDNEHIVIFNPTVIEVVDVVKK